MNAASATLVKQGDLLRTKFMNPRNVPKKQIRSNKDEQNLEEQSAIALHAIKTGHTVAFESTQPVITNVRNPYERLVAEQLTVKATEKKHCNRKDA